MSWFVNCEKGQERGRERGRERENNSTRKGGTKHAPQDTQRKTAEPDTHLELFFFFLRTCSLVRKNRNRKKCEREREREKEKEKKPRHAGHFRFELIVSNQPKPTLSKVY